MSFADNLVARSLGRTDAIRPRLASMFEPARVVAAALQAPPAARNALRLEEIEAEATAQQQPPTPKPGVPGPHKRTNRRNSPASDGPAESRPLEIEALTNAQERETREPRRWGRRPEEESRAPFSREEKNSTRLTAGSPSPLQSAKAAPATASLEEHRVISSTPESPGAPLAGNSVVRAGVPNTGTQLVAAMPFRPGDADAFDVLGARRHDRERRLPALNAREPREDAEPVIEVTIGRIEILAETTAGPARRREPQAPPVMSLEEYLRHKSNRGNV